MAAARIENKSTFGLAAILLAVWCFALLVAFLAFRGTDIGQLPRLIGGLRFAPLFGIAIVDTLAGAAAALAIVACWFGVGSFATSLIKVTASVPRSHVLELALSTAVGAAIWSLVFFFLGITSGYDRITGLFAIIVGLGIAAYGIRTVLTMASVSRVPESPSIYDKALLGLVAVALLLAAITAVAPPIAKDTLLYHFSVPKAFIAHGGMTYVDGNIASYMSLGAEMHVTWAMLLGSVWSPRAGEVAAGLILWAFFPILLAVVFGWARELNVERRWSILAMLIVASVPTIYYVAASGYVDIASTMYITLGIYALCRWWRTPEWGWAVFVGILIGAALAIKLTTLFVVAAFALVILWRARQATEVSGSADKVFARGASALMLAIVFASPWYVRTWIETGSPIFPFYTSIWEGHAPGWDSERSSLIQEKDAEYGGKAKTPFDYILTPLTLSITAQPDDPIYFDGVLGVSFLFGMATLGWALWKFDLPIEAKVGAMVSATLFAFWLSSSQQLRYLLAILPVLSIAIVLAINAIEASSSGFRRAAQVSLGVFGIAGILVSSAWFLRVSPVRVALGGESREDFLVRNVDYYPYYAWLNTETAKDSKVWLINMRRDSYYLDRPYFSDYLFEDWTLKKMLWASQSAEELKAKTVEMGISTVLVRHDFLFDYRISPLVDETKTKEENDAKLAIAKAFLLDKRSTVNADERFSLIRVF